MAAGNIKHGLIVRPAAPLLRWPPALGWTCLLSETPTSQPAALPPDLFSPRAVAVLGASGDPTKLAHRPLAYLRRHRYGGDVYPINPRGGEILGWPCRASLDEVDGPVDAALISLPAALVPEALQRCADRGVRLAVVLSAGLADDLAPPAGLAVMGPNCMGFLNARQRVGASWSSSLDLPALKAGRVGLITQSGGLGGAVLNRLQDRGEGLSYAFWTGNEFYLDTCDLVKFLLDDPETQVVALLVEGLRRPKLLLELADQALERRKTLVVLKLARSPASASMAIAHTGILAGTARAYRAAFRQHGIVEVGSLDDLVETAALFARTPLPAGDGLAVISSSGGATVLVTDLCQEIGVRLSPLGEDTKRDIAALLPSYAPAPTNPLDITAGLSEESLFRPLERLAADPQVDMVLNVVTMLGGAERMRQRAEGLRRAQQRVPVPILSCWMAGSLAQDGLAILAECGLPYYTAPEACVRGIKALLDHRRHLDTPRTPRRPTALAGAADSVRAQLQSLRATGARVVAEREAAVVLAQYGLRLVESRPAASAVAAVAAADALDYPVVVKADVPGLAHKASAGGVCLAVRDAADVVTAFESIRAAISRNLPDAAFRGVLVQPQAAAAPEAVLGIARDAQFGPLVLLGLGGVHAEALGQAAVRLAPLSYRDAEELVDETSFGNLPGRQQLVEAAVGLGWFARDCADLVDECDLNPVRVYPDGVLALDALLILTAAE